MNADAQAIFKEKLDTLCRDFASRLPARVDEIHTACQRLAAGEASVAEAEALHRTVHKLAGSGKTFGFPSVSTCAHELEEALSAALVGEHPPAPARAHRIDELASALVEAALTPAIALSSGTEARPSAPSDPRSHPEENPLVFIIDDDEILVRELGLELASMDFRTRTFTGRTGVLEALDEQAPAAVVMDIGLREGALSGVELMARLQSHARGRLPAVFISSRGDLVARLAAVRAGAQAYFTKPLDVSALAATLLELTGHGPREPYRVLVVDDDSFAGAGTAITLRAAGMLAEVAEDPMHVGAPLADLQPDLVLMDLYLPGYSGAELAAVLRQQEQYLGLPILFLSNETDPDHQRVALERGGDEFLTKPVDPHRLVTIVRARARRGRALRSLVSRDGLTGLLSHSTLLQRLEVELARSSRNGRPVSCALIDIDRFHRVNERYGYATGDRVLLSLARLLERRLRKTDSVGRYGGKEICVVLPDTPGPTARRVLDSIRESFSAVQLFSPRDGEAFSVSFSCGIATVPPSCEARELLNLAGQALYLAKLEGRDRIELAVEEGVDTTDATGSGSPIYG